MYYAIAGGLTAADVARPDVRGAVRDIEQSIVDYAKTADDFLGQMGRLGTDYAHAVAVQERSLVLFNEESPDARLVAAYPSEGTFVADYPLIVLHAPWVDADERLAAEIFQDWLLPQITPELVAPFGYRAPGSHRTVPPIDEAHGADPNQPQRILPPPAPDVIATIQDNWNEDRKPANVVLVVDTSASVGREGLLRPQQEALGAFLDELRPADRVGLVTFASEVFEPVPVVSLSAGENDLRETIRDLIPGEASSLYDAVHTGFATLRRLADDSRVNVVVLVSDGADDASSRTLDELARELEDACENGPLVIPVIAVAYGDEADTEALERIAAACPGRTLPATPEDVVDVLRTVALLF
jgi:Ca-activated chloride channel family protein